MQTKRKAATSHWSEARDEIWRFCLDAQLEHAHAPASASDVSEQASEWDGDVERLRMFGTADFSEALSL